MAPRPVFESATFRMHGTKPTTEPPHPTSWQQLILESYHNCNSTFRRHCSKLSTGHQFI